MEKTVFFIHHPGKVIENVIVFAHDREQAKRHACHILGGNPDNYVVDPITRHGSRTVILFGGSGS